MRKNKNIQNTLLFPCTKNQPMQGVYILTNWIIGLQLPEHVAINIKTEES